MVIWFQQVFVLILFIVAPAGIISGLNTSEIEVECKENQIKEKLADWVFEPSINDELPYLCTR